MRADETISIGQRGLLAFESLRKQAAKAGVQDLSLDEINAMIKEVRNESRK